MSGSEPPSAAKRLALSREIKASRPARMTAVFSWIPDSDVALSSSWSSMFNVVLMQINMHESYILCKYGVWVSLNGCLFRLNADLKWSFFSGFVFLLRHQLAKDFFVHIAKRIQFLNTDTFVDFVNGCV